MHQLQNSSSPTVSPEYSPIHVQQISFTANGHHDDQALPPLSPKPSDHLLISPHDYTVAKLSYADLSAAEESERDLLEKQQHNSLGHGQITPGWNSQGVWRRLRSAMPKSLYLRRYFLICLVFLFVFFLVVLEVLNYFSNRDQGFVSADEGKHYLWTYGPTFVLTIITAIWGQLEYRIQQAMPWMELRQERLPANKTLLVNYLTPWSIVSLFRSLSARHYPVALSIIGGFTLKILIVVSTGLLVLESNQLTYGTQFLLADQFDLSMTGFKTHANPVDSGIALWAISQGDAAYPPGTTPEYATQSFSATSTDLTLDYTTTANVSVFGVEQNCTTFSWTYDKGSTKGDPFSLADIMSKNDFDELSPFCVVRNGNSSVDPHPSLTNNVSSYYLNRTVLVDLDCPNDDFDPVGSDTLRLFTTVVVDLPKNVSSVSALFCRPHYSITRRLVTTSWDSSTGGNVRGISPDIIETMELGIAPSILTNDILESMSAFEVAQLSELTYGSNYWVTLMNLTTPQSDWKAFANTTLLSTAFQRTFRALAVLAAKSTKAMPATGNQMVSGLLTSNAPRLTVTPIALRVMEALLVLLALVALLLSFFNFEPVSRHPISLISTAAILARSNQLAQTLSGGQVPRMDRLAANLQGHLFSSPLDLATIRMEGSSYGTGLDMPPEKEILRRMSKTSQWWVPTGVTRPFRMSLLATKLLMFITLEVLFQLSRKNNGLVDVPTSGYTRYVWLFLPTLVMSGVALADVAMDKAMRTLHSYSELSRSKPKNRDAMVFDPQASTSLFALAQAFQRRCFALSTGILTSILGSLLVIAASGLYSTSPAQDSASVSLDAETWFDIRTTSRLTENNVDFNTPDVMSSQAIQFNNMSLPPLTYGEYAFAAPETGGIRLYDAFNSSFKFTARVPATRVQSNCSLYEFRDSVIGTDGQRVGNVEITPPLGCTKPPGGDQSGGNKITLGQGGGVRPKTGYFGYVARLSWNTSLWDQSPYTVCNDSTQHLFVVYGNQVGNDAHNLTVLHCLPFVEALDVEATFALPSLIIDATSHSPPLAINPIVPWHSSNRAQNSIPFPDPSVVGNYDGTNLDPFFTILIRGKSGTPMSELTGRDNVDRMIAHLNSLYQQLGAQALHFNYRRPLSNITSNVKGLPMPGRVEGTVHAPAPGRARLIQTELSTRLLEALLLCLAICVGLSFWFVEETRILPVDPGSLAARMALLAGSELIARLQREGDHDLEGETFALGWWEVEEAAENNVPRSGRWYGIDIIPQ